MDLRKLSDRLARWVRWTTLADFAEWQDFVETVETRLRLVVHVDTEGAAPETPMSGAEFIAEGRALFAELSKLTDSPLVVRRLQSAMEALGRGHQDTFRLRSGPSLSVIPGGARSDERPSARYIDDSADDAPKAG